MSLNEQTKDEASAEEEPLEEQRALLSDRIRSALAEEITTGALKPGAALDEQQLATRFGASRTPVREALRQLSVTGMVEIRPRRGVVVTPLTPERIMDMFEMTAEIEAMCVRLATWRMTPLERSQLQQLHDGSAEMVRAGNLDAYDDFNRRFHEALYRATHNQFMVEQAMALRTRMGAFRRTQLRQGDRMNRSRSEHDELMRAMARGDGEEAARCMRAHLLNASSALSHYINAL